MMRASANRRKAAVPYGSTAKRSPSAKPRKRTSTKRSPISKSTGKGKGRGTPARPKRQKKGIGRSLRAAGSHRTFQSGFHIGFERGWKSGMSRGIEDGFYQMYEQLDA